jgi:hypothetical protein
MPERTDPVNPRLFAFLAFIAAIFLLGPLVSFAAPAERWFVNAPAPGAKVAPTFIVTGTEPAAWPLDYVAGWAEVGAPCDCSSSFPPAGLPDEAGTYCLVRKQRAALCGVAK